MDQSNYENPTDIESPEELFRTIVDGANIEIGKPRYTELHFSNGNMYILPDTLSDGFRFHLASSGHSMYDRLNDRLVDYRQKGYPVDQLLKLKLQSSLRDGSPSTLSARGFITKNSDGGYVFEFKHSNIGSRSNSSDQFERLKSTPSSLGIVLKNERKEVNFNQQDIVPALERKGTGILNLKDSEGEPKSGGILSGLVYSLRIHHLHKIDSERISVEFEGVQGNTRDHESLLRRLANKTIEDNGIFYFDYNGSRIRLIVRYTIDTTDKSIGLSFSILDEDGEISNQDIKPILAVLLQEILELNQSLLIEDWDLELTLFMKGVYYGKSYKLKQGIGLDENYGSNEIFVEKALNQSKYIYSKLILD